MTSDGQFQQVSRSSLTDYAWYCANAYSNNDPYGLYLSCGDQGSKPMGLLMYGNVSEWVYDTEVGFGGTDYWSYTPDSAFGLLRGGGFYDQPEQLSSYFVFEQMDKCMQVYAGFRLVRRLDINDGV